MVKIPEKIKEFIENQGVFLVGTVGGDSLSNVSPRIFFKVEEDSIYWLDFFKHKSYTNMQTTHGSQLQCLARMIWKDIIFAWTINFITDEPTKSEIRESLIRNTLKTYPSPKVFVRKRL